MRVRSPRGQKNNRFEQFRHRVFCRRPLDQRYAMTIWKEINDRIPEIPRNRFAIEWAHYRIGQIDVHEFSDHFSKISKYF